MKRSEFIHLTDAHSMSEAFGSVDPGTKGQAMVRVGSMASGQPINVPLLVARGRVEGPVLWLNGAVHGDEINGILATMDFLEQVDCATLKGSIIATPVSNPTALDARSKRVPQDDQDLDQSFPGQSSGMLSQLLAATIFAGIRELADVVVNFHTMNPYFSSVPYAVYKVVGEEAATEQSLLKAISNFAPFVACRMSVSSSKELPGNNSGALDYQCLKAGKLAFMIELGGGSRQEPDYIRAGVEGLKALCGQLSMIDFDSGKEVDRLSRVVDRTHVFTNQGGFFRQLATAGSLLPTGSPLGRIQTYAGEVIEEITFEQDVLVIGVRTDPVIHSGDRVGFVALEWGDYDVG